MKITKVSPFSGKVHTMEIDVTPEQFIRYLEGELIQRAMPNVSAPEREFIKTGITPEEWEKEFAE